MQPIYPELNRDIIMVRRPVLGPNVAMKETEQVASAPKHRTVAAATLSSNNVGVGMALNGMIRTYGSGKPNTGSAIIPIETVVRTVFTDLRIHLVPR